MSHLSRRDFIKRASLAGTSLLLPSSIYQSIGSGSPPEYVEAETAFGKIRGMRKHGVNIYKGVPYAGSVSGKHRFKNPAPLKPWTGVKDALRLGPPSPQIPVQTYGIDEPKPAEDCLVLNIWTPDNDNFRRPVMFYNHGGGFTHGSGGGFMQDGANLARYFGVVVVEINHRLGVLGFLYLKEVAGEEYAGSGNMGLLDIVEALKWVKQNISGFGGDPDNVMIFGESGGGAKTSCLYSMPAAVPYFHKASIESGPGVKMNTPEKAAQTTWMLLKELGLSPKKWQPLVHVPVPSLMAVQARLLGIPNRTSKPHVLGIDPVRLGEFGPVVDGSILPRHPFLDGAPEISAEKPLMVGWNEDEYTFFGWMSGDLDAFDLSEVGLTARLKEGFGPDAEKIYSTYAQTRPDASPTEIFVEIMSVTFTGLGSVHIAEAKAKQNKAPVYLYSFGYKSEVPVPGTDYPFGTPHAMDVAFKFNNVEAASEDMKIEFSMAGHKMERFAASRNFAQMWAGFAHTGHPKADGQPQWPPYNTDTRPLMRINTDCEVIYNRNKEEMEMWRELGYL